MKCNKCSFELWNPIIEFGYTTLGLYDDSRYPGRCILCFDEHYDHLTEMGRDNYYLFMEEVYQAGFLLKETLKCERINYAILGNTESHVHAHLIPRYGTDPVPNKSPWDHPDKATPMTKENKERIVRLITDTSMRNYEIRDDSSL